ncbi:putative Bet v I/Major latex protein [Helianthus anomalus]
MGVFTYTDEHTSPVASARIFKASILDSHILMPKLLPDAITSIQLIKGDSGAGSIKQINFAGGFAKHQIDEVDEKTFTYKYTLIEGNGVSDKIEKVSYDIKFDGSPDGGSMSQPPILIPGNGRPCASCGGITLLIYLAAEIFIRTVSISKMTTTIYTHGDFEIKEEELKAGKEKVLGLYKVVEAYLLKNPDAYV